MPNQLEGKTIILTGSSVVASVTAQITEVGGVVEHFPLIETEETVIQDADFLHQLDAYDWFIFTSQNGVHYFAEKCRRACIPFDSIKARIASVGKKTTEQLQQLGFFVHFMPTTYSADTFVQQFKLAPDETALFIKGSLAKSTIRDAIKVDEWTVYETKQSSVNVLALTKCLKQAKHPILIFASPSAVRTFATSSLPLLEMGKVKIASIGHVTTAELFKYGITPHIQPEIYTMQAVIEQLILEEQSK